MNSKTNLPKIGRKKSHRESLQKNLVSDLLVYEYVTTTKAKSKLALHLFADVIKLAKSDKTEYEKRRLLTRMLGNENAVTKVLDVFTKRFADETSGLVKLYKVENRKGDNAPQVKMMVKGYVYKQIGKKVAEVKKAKAKKTENEEAEKKPAQGIRAAKDLSQKDQIQGAANSAKVKTRSGI